MLKRIGYLILGIVLIVIGLILFINSFQSINGLAIVEDPNASNRGFAGIYFIFAGLFSLLLSKKRKVKGQAAIEFLMTYGWAILAAVIVLGALSFFGIFNPGSFSPAAAVLNPPFYMNAWSVTPSALIFDIKNTGSEIYHITEVRVSYTEGSCNSASDYTVTSGNSVVVIIPCSLELGKIFNGDIIIKYRRSESNLIQTVYGTIRDRVLSGVSYVIYSLNLTIIGNGIVDGTYSVVGGVIHCSNPECDFNFINQTQINLVPKAGVFEGWSGDVCDGQLEDCDFIINSSVTLTANFD